MRWFKIRKADIPSDERELFERFGVNVIGATMASGFHGPALELHPIYDDSRVRKRAADWLTEQYDRAERKETWSITMEAAITVFVIAETVLSALGFLRERT